MMKKSFFALLIAVSFISAGPVYGETLSPALISYWDLNDTSGGVATDAATVNNGTIYGATAATAVAGNGLQFDGSSNFIYINDDPSLHTTTMSFSLWVKPDTDQTSDYPRLLDKYCLSQGFFVSGIDNKWMVHINGWVLYATSDIKLGEWSHLAATYDGSALSIFVDGVNEATVYPFRPLINDTDQPLRIGSNGLAYFKGSLDEIALYNRGLTSGEVQILYQNGLQGVGIGSVPAEDAEEPVPPAEEPVPPAEEPDPLPAITFIDIDILPNDDSNSFRLSSKKAVPVAVLTTADFNAADIDPSSVAFGPAGAAPVGGAGTLEDVDNDGDLDAVFSFKASSTGLTCSDTEAILSAETSDGEQATGIDYVGSSTGCADSDSGDGSSTKGGGKGGKTGGSTDDGSGGGGSTKGGGGKPTR